VTRLIPAVAAAALATVVLTGCTPAEEARAASLAERIAIAMADDIAPAHFPEPLSGEHLAWWATETPRLPSEQSVEYTIDAYGWSGNSGEDEGARFSVRIDVHMLYIPSQGWTSHRPESAAVRCWDFTVRAIPEWQGAVEHRGVACPEGALAAPTPDTLLVMPDDVDARLSAVIVDATLADLEARIRTAFPDPGFSVVVEERNGFLVVALGVPRREQSCAVGVKHADGTVEVLRGFSPESLLPGEMGCHPMLYLGGIDLS
jgi:hypothetical protein